MQVQVVQVMEVVQVVQVVDVEDVHLEGGQGHVEAGKEVRVPGGEGQVPQLRVVVQDLGSGGSGTTRAQQWKTQ